MRWLLVLALSLLSNPACHAQELYPLAEPASNIPKGVLGIRAFGQTYSEINNRHRNLIALKLMYGLSSKITLAVTGSVSNHHNKTLPSDFPYHNTPQLGVHLPYLYNGTMFFAKYRFFSRDGQNRHYRLAAYAQYSLLHVAHDEAEPTILDDTKGFEGGIINTYLIQRFACSFTLGYIHPSPYKGEVPDPIPGLPGAPAKIVYGDAVNYSLSIGYLLLPLHNENYNQTNVNIYLEFLGKSYNRPEIFLENVGQPGSAYQIIGLNIPALNPGNYIEVHPGIQAIIRSNLRVDLSVGFPMVKRSYEHFYPVYTIGIQRYFYL